MNQLFIEKLHQSTTEKNKNLLESIERLYVACEEKAMMESKFGQIAGAAALAGAAGLGGVAVSDSVKNLYNDAKDGYTQVIEDNKIASKNMGTASTVANRSYEGLSVLGGKHGWKYVDVSEHPGLYSDSFNNMALEQLDKEDYVQVGWYVSPDGRKYYSTVTGDVYQMPDGQTFNDATNANRGKKLGNGVLATGEVKDDEVSNCSISKAAMYGPDSECGGKGYQLMDDQMLDWVGAKK